MNDWIKGIIGQVVRHALTLAAGLLTAYGVTAAEQDAFVGSTTAVIVAVILFLVSQIWGAKAKADTEVKIETALDMPAHTSRGRLEDVISNK